MPPRTRQPGSHAGQPNRPVDDGAGVAIDRLLVDLPPERGQLLPALLLVQDRDGFVSDLAVLRIAVRLRLTANEVEAVATAYPELHRHPLGARVVRVCAGLGCWTAGGATIASALESALGVRVGETDAAGAITLEAAPCCFVCGVAPVVEVDGVLHGRVDGESAVALATAGRGRGRPDG